MNKRLNTVLFILAGTIVNVIFAIFFVLVLLLILGNVGPFLGKDKISILILFCIIAGILISMIVYQKLSVWVIKKFNIQDKLDPLFTSHRSKKN